MKRQHDGTLLFAPSDLIKFMESEFVTWMDRFYAEHRGEVGEPDKPSPTEAMLQKKGTDHEFEYLRRLVDAGKDVCNLADVRNRREATLQAMAEGHEIIFQAELWDDQFAGFADFLVRAQGTSKFGDYIYEPWDTKLALHAKPYYLVQLACYADMLTLAQGAQPQHLYVVLGDKSERRFRTQDYMYFYRQLRQAFLLQQQKFDENEPPEFGGKEDFGRWTTHAERIIKETDHLCQVANIRMVQIRRLKEAGIDTMTGLAKTKACTVERMKQETFDLLKWQARLQVESAELDRPKWEPIRPQEEGRGLYLVPPASQSDVFFDMEGFPQGETKLEYLFGATILEEPHFVDWWAHTPEAEKAEFEKFIDWLHARWQADPSMHVYHYAAYEKTAMRQLSSKYSTRQDEVDDLLRNEVFVDLFTVVRQSIKVGTPNYSIKSIEKLYREKRHGEVATAQDSIVFYQNWLDCKDGDDWKTSVILNQIREYNKEDCDSTQQLAQWIRGVQSELGISWQPPPDKKRPEDSAAEIRNNAAKLAQDLLFGIPVEGTLTEDEAVRRTLAHLLEFHWREAKPVFWAKYDRHHMSDRELFEDPCCLARLQQIGPPRLVKNSHHYEYSFDPDQDTKIDAGNRCFLADNLRETIDVASIDADAGRITLKRRMDRPAPPQLLSLIKDEYVPTDDLANSIYRTVSKYAGGIALPRALDDLLNRRKPRIRDHSGGPLLPPDTADIARATKELLLRLDESTLCIQGPPGSGKTYTAAQAILHLLQNGKRVGVVSNSHKAIAHLLDKVSEQAEQSSFALRAVKVQTNGEENHCKSSTIKILDTKKLLNDPSQFHLIGGTAWLFAKEESENLVDFLFVDEAGQVSLANIAAIAPSTSNIVLIGDQMQLSQPLQGTHPGESGKSALEYLLQKEQVIPDDFGIFLGTSFRMRTEVCSFISGAVYEDRLKSHASAEKRALNLPPSATEFLTQSSGVLYVPVQHDGCMQDSEEEAQIICQILRELETCSLTLGEETHRFNPTKDVLIVAPYNMQVRKLRKYAPGVPVGSVDKFQGQEAPVVIISMCSSTGDASPRGLEFIFSKNRLNVAISRAQVLAVVVGSPALAHTRCKRVEQMELVNLFCRIVDEGSQSPIVPRGIPAVAKPG